MGSLKERCDLAYQYGLTFKDKCIIMTSYMDECKDPSVVSVGHRIYDPIAYGFDGTISQYPNPAIDVKTYSMYRHNPTMKDFCILDDLPIKYIAKKKKTKPMKKYKEGGKSKWLSP